MAHKQRAFCTRSGDGNVTQAMCFKGAAVHYWSESQGQCTTDTADGDWVAKATAVDGTVPEWARDCIGKHLKQSKCESHDPVDEGSGTGWRRPDNIVLVSEHVGYNSNMDRDSQRDKWAELSLRDGVCEAYGGKFPSLGLSTGEIVGIVVGAVAVVCIVVVVGLVLWRRKKRYGAYIAAE